MALKKIPHLQQDSLLYFSVFKLQARTARDYKLEDRAILFTKAICLGNFAVFLQTSPTSPSCMIQPLLASVMPPVHCSLGYASLESLFSCSGPFLQEVLLDRLVVVRGGEMNDAASSYPMASLYMGDLYLDITKVVLYDKFNPAGPVLSIWDSGNMITH